MLFYIVSLRYNVLTAVILVGGLSKLSSPLGQVRDYIGKDVYFFLFSMLGPASAGVRLLPTKVDYTYSTYSQGDHGGSSML